MNTRIETRKAIIMTLMSVIITIAALFLISHVSLKKQLREEKINSEAILSEKLLLEKQMIGLKTDLTSLKGKNSQLDKLLSATSNKLSSKEAEVKRFLSERVSLSELKKKVAELEAIRVQLNSEIASLAAKSNLLLTENDVLNNKLTSLQQEKERVDNDNAVLKAMVADNYLIEAVKGRNNKLTLIARKTDKLVVSFDLPVEIDDNVSFKVITPTGEEFSSNNNSAASIIIIDNASNYLASADNRMLAFNPRRVEMIFKPEHKLEKGIYRFNVYNNNNYLGSTQLKLK
jgi:hypothetical protein